MYGRGTFRARVLGFHERQGDGGMEGVATIQVAAFGVPDTYVAVGNDERQVIDQGAFQQVIQIRAGQTIPFGVDHFDALPDGMPTLLKKAGYIDGDSLQENDKGLQMDAHYALRTFVGQQAYELARFDPNGTQFSFSWTDDDVYRGDDKMQHVRSFADIVEVSQVLMGAQEETGVVSMRMAGMRTVIRSHGTDTSDDAWDVGANAGNLDPADDAAMKKAHAWYDGSAPDPDGDGYPDRKSDWKFLHHFVGSDGTVGAASTRAASNGIGVLNGGRGGANIPDGDRQGVYSHLAKHLTDGGKDAPALRSADELAREAILEDDQFLESVAELASRHKLHGEQVPPKPTVGVLKEWLKDDDFREKLKKLVERQARANSITQLAQVVSSTWWSAHRDQIMSGGADWSYVEDVWVDDGTLQSGFAIVADDDGDYQKIPWTVGPDGDDILFDEFNATEVTKEYVVEGSPLRAALQQWAHDQRAAAQPQEDDTLGQLYSAMFQPVGHHAS